MAIDNSLPPMPARTTVASPPSHLDQPERRLWRKIVVAHRFDDAASIALLAVALDAHQRARRCREAIARDGETYLDRFRQPRPHPLLTAETHARAAFLAAMKALRLDLVGVEP